MAKELRRRRSDGPINYQEVLEPVALLVKDDLKKGKVANYIPALARVPKSKFAMAVRCVDGREATVGDAFEPFSIQSVSKVFTLIGAFFATLPSFFACTTISFSSLASTALLRVLPLTA